jgi:hypothetical protein
MPSDNIAKLSARPSEIAGTLFRVRRTLILRKPVRVGVAILALEASKID